MQTYGFRESILKVILKINIGICHKYQERETKEENVSPECIILGAKMMKVVIIAKDYYFALYFCYYHIIEFVGDNSLLHTL